MNREVRVLVVDDSDFFGTLVAGELAALYDMDVESVTGPREALDRLDAGGFDCVVSDYDMSGMDGIELFDRLRERGDDVPFILLTAAGSEAVASQAITAGVTDYFPKERDEEQFEILGKRILNVVAQRRAERDLKRQRRLHEDLWQVTQDLVHAPTREDIDRQVCRRLAAVARFSFAWVSDGVPGEGVRAVAGLDPADLGLVRDGLPDADGPRVTAVEDRTVQSTTVDTPAAVGDQRLGVVVVPLLYREDTYGVLGLGMPADGGLTGGEREALERLGATVGHALAAVEREREVETFREAVEQADPAVVITDTDGTIEYVNRTFEELTGYSSEDALGESFHGVVTGWGPERSEAVRERVRRGEPVREELVQQRKDGTQFHADLSVAPITLDRDDTRKFVAIESDITDIRSREQRLQVLNRILRHNLRNDLNVIQGRLSLLLDRVDDEEARSHADLAQAKLADLLELSEKVRSVDQTIRAAREADRTTPVVLGELLCDEAERVREEYPEATVTVDAVEAVRVRGTNLDVAIRELLVNGVEHNDSDPQVSLTADRDGGPEGFVSVEIRDDGPGIPDVERDVLERGQETKLEHGRSLGLWLVNWVVTHAGGELDIADAPGGGSTVRLSLPLAAETDR